MHKHINFNFYNISGVISCLSSYPKLEAAYDIETGHINSLACCATSSLDAVLDVHEKIHRLKIAQRVKNDFFIKKFIYRVSLFKPGYDFTIRGFDNDLNRLMLNAPEMMAQHRAIMRQTCTPGAPFESEPASVGFAIHAKINVTSVAPKV